MFCQTFPMGKWPLLATSSTKEEWGLTRQVRGGGECLPPRLPTRVPFLRQWKGKTDFHKLCSDLHIRVVVCACTHTHVHVNKHKKYF